MLPTHGGPLVHQRKVPTANSERWAGPLKRVKKKSLTISSLKSKKNKRRRRRQKKREREKVSRKDSAPLCKADLFPAYFISFYYLKDNAHIFKTWLKKETYYITVMGLAAIVVMNMLDISLQRNRFWGLRPEHSLGVARWASFLDRKDRIWI